MVGLLPRSLRILCPQRGQARALKHGSIQLQALESTLVDNVTCLFCKIVAREVAARLVFEDEVSLAFLDHRPVFPGHCLLIPKQHFETLTDLPVDLIGPFFRNVQLLARAVESAIEAHGTLVAINNRVSQSVPHLHTHIVPRRRKDGLKGFFWPRQPYKNEEEADLVQEAIRRAVAELMNSTKVSETRHRGPQTGSPSGLGR
jgi:histidine triad (HIT) family protein